jgi:hypothetical protein
VKQLGKNNVHKTPFAHLEEEPTRTAASKKGSNIDRFPIAKQFSENNVHKTPAAHLEDQPVRLVAELRHGLLQELWGRLKLVEVLSSNLEIEENGQKTA